MDARTSGRASQHAHHCGAGTHRIPTAPRGFPTAHPAHSESLSIGAIRGLSPDQISSGMPYNCYDVAFWRTPSLACDAVQWFFGQTGCQWSDGFFRNYSSSTRSPAVECATGRLCDQQRRRSPFSLARSTRVTMIRLHGNKRVLRSCPCCRGGQATS